MVQRILRPLWFPIVAGFIVWSSSLIQGCLDILDPPREVGLRLQDPYADQSISIGGLIKDTMDPWAFAIAALAALIAGRGRGTAIGIRFVFGGLGRGSARDVSQALEYRTASQVLFAAGRGLLWASLALNLYYLSQLPWFVESKGNQIVSWEQLRYVMGGSFAALTFGPLFLLPLARQAARWANDFEGGASRKSEGGAGALDVLASFGLAFLSFLVPLTAWRARLIDPDGPPQSAHVIHWPDIVGIDLGLLIWSLGFVPVLVLLAFLPNWGELRKAETWRPLGQMALISSILGVLVVFTKLWKDQVLNGGEADYEVLALEAGRSLTPLLVGLVLAVCAWMWTRSRSQNR